MNAIIESRAVTQVARLEALLRTSQAISTTGNHRHSIEIFMRELHSVVNFNYLFISDCAEDAGETKWVLEANGRRFEPAEVAFPLQECTGRWVHQEQQGLLIADWNQEHRFPVMREFLRGHGIVSTCALPLVRPRHRFGVLEFGSSLPNAYGQQDEIGFLSLVADQVALALDAEVISMSSEIAESRLKLLLELTNSVVSTLEIRDVLRAVCASVRRV